MDKEESTNESKRAWVELPCQIDPWDLSSAYGADFREDGTVAVWADPGELAREIESKIH